MMEGMPSSIVSRIVIFSIAFWGLSCASASEVISFNSSKVLSTCRRIANTVTSASAVHYPGSSQYVSDIAHFVVTSSEQSTCSVEPGNSEDVSIILKILGESKTPFAVKSGGHIFNPNYSSTTGVQVSLARFNQIQINFNESSSDELSPSDSSIPPAAGSVTIGTGLIWDDVYAALDPYNLTVVGGRLSGIGVGGFILGGGFSYKTNEYGLTVANVVSFEIVLPNGTIASASRDENEDLFWAVRGSHNNFGIVTAITLKTYPQGLVWGGYINYHLPSLSSPITQALINATLKYANQQTDPKAGNVVSWFSSGGNATLSIRIFYAAPTPAPGIFDDYLAIPNIASNISTRTYSDLIRAPPSNATLGFRGYMDVVLVQNYTYEFIEAVINETIFWGNAAVQIDPTSVVNYPMEPFLSTILDHDIGGSSWPPQTPNVPVFFPQGIEFSWTNASTDEWFFNTIQASHKHLASVLERGHQNPSLPLYPNYALYTATPEDIWGENLDKLVEIKRNVDIADVMGLAGGWKVPLRL